MTALRACAVLLVLAAAAPAADAPSRSAAGPGSAVAARGHVPGLPAAPASPRVWPPGEPLRADVPVADRAADVALSPAPAVEHEAAPLAFDDRMDRGVRLAFAPEPPVAAAIALPALAVRRSRAQPPEVGAELDVLAVLAGAPAAVRRAAVLHVEARYPSGPMTLNVMLDPGVWLDAGIHLLPPVTEAYVQTRRGAFDLRVGVERIPLEVARLTLPFGIEPVDALGNRRGRLGARVAWFPDDATRVRLAVLRDGRRVGPVLSVRREFAEFEVEGHALTRSGRAAFGLGGSGLAGRLVVYGEVWRLTAPSEWRYAVGVSGSIPDGLWTIEGGRAAAVPGAPPRLQLAGQIAKSLREDLTATMTGRLFRDPGARRGQVVFEITRTIGNVEVTLGLGGLLGPEPFRGVAATTFRFSF